MTGTGRRARRPRLIAIFAVCLAVVGGLVAVVLPAASSPAAAANASDFQPGYLISDQNFFDSQSMTVADVQAFLNSKVTSCSGSNGMPCLKDYYAQSTPALAANSYCAATPGGTLSAAQVIVLAAQACGINPKVILVMLQKEQGLITSTAPTARNYSAALGQGCPDGAACDPAYAGFFYQVYGAARQFQVYIKNPKSFGYQLGWNNILYQATPPDNSRICGTKPVYIQNDATRALYIYTPYTPNQAALDNLYGTGDFCSTYGNRNFWRLYTDWFGNPLSQPVEGAYADAWQALGGASGILGSPLGGVVCIDSKYCQQSFTGGTIFWFPGRGVFGVPTLIETMWRNLGFITGTPGLPTGVVVCNPDGTCVQSFDGGVIAADSTGGSLVGSHVASAWLAAGGVALGGARGPELCSPGGSQCAQLFARAAFYTSGTQVTSVTGPIFTAWNTVNSSSGPLGYPLSNAACVSAGCTQQFSGGLIVSSGTVAYVIPSGIAAKYTSMGGIATLGAPSGPADCAASSACAQTFANGRIDVAASGSAIATTQGFYRAWAAVGLDSGVLKLPTGEATCSSVTCMQSFVGGALVGTTSAGIVPVIGQYRDVWMAAGGPTGSLGLPMGVDSCNGMNCSQVFQGGVLVWTPTYGVASVSSWFLAPWQAQGSGAGALGAPTGNSTCSSVTCMQSFVGGALVGTTSAGIVPVIGQYRDVWMAAGGPTGSLGLPMGVDSCNGMNCSQVFQGGVLVWTPTYGVASVSSWFLAPWQAQGSGAGALGAPTGNSTCSSVTCMQSFVGGALVGTTSAGIVPVLGAYRDIWVASGGVTGALGLPTGVTQCNGRWCAAPFAGGSILWSPATGAYAVSGAVNIAWVGAGGAAGTYGLPIAAATTSNGKVSQRFQFGVISVNG